MQSNEIVFLFSALATDPIHFLRSDTRRMSNNFYGALENIWQLADDACNLQLLTLENQRQHVYSKSVSI